MLFVYSMFYHSCSSAGAGVFLGWIFSLVRGNLAISLEDNRKPYCCKSSGLTVLPIDFIFLEFSVGMRWQGHIYQIGSSISGGWKIHCTHYCSYGYRELG